MPAFRKLKGRWIMVAVFSAISIHSFIFNQKSTLYADSVQSAGTSFEAGQISSLVKVNGFEGDGRAFNTSEGPHHQNLKSIENSKAQTNFAQNTDATRSHISVARASRSKALKVEIGTSMYSTMPKADAIIQSESSRTSNQTSSSIGEIGRIISLRPLARPSGFEVIVERSRTNLSDERMASILPVSYLRPLPRPSIPAVSVANLPTPKQAAQTDIVDAAISEVRASIPQSSREEVPRSDRPRLAGTQDPATEHIGIVLGLFETKALSWALVKDRSGRILILKPGDSFGDRVVSSIGEGLMLVSSGNSMSAYRLGDEL